MTDGESDGVGESLVILLSQGLQSEDSQKVDSVLSNADARTIASTLRDLPVIFVLPLLKQLEMRLRTRNITTLREQLGSLHAWMTSRTEHTGKLLTLHGKLVMLTDQIDRRMNPQSFASQQPAFVLQQPESSSDSDSGDDDDDGDGGIAASGITSGDDDEADWWEEKDSNADEEEEEEEEGDDMDDE